MESFCMKKNLLAIFLSIFSISGGNLSAALFPPPSSSKPAPVTSSSSSVPSKGSGLSAPFSLSESLYSDLKTAVQNTGAPLPVANWLNAMQIESFYQTTFHTLLSQEKYFNSRESLDQHNPVITPYGFKSSIKLGNENFKFDTLGVSAAGTKTFKEVWVLGGGVGYLHSNLNWGKGTKIDTIFFGPQATYLMKQGFIQLMAAGMYNMYDNRPEFAAAQKKSGDHTGWNLLTRLESGVDVKVPFFERFTFFVQPNISLNYLGDFENNYTEQGSNGLKTLVKTGYSDFFSSRLSLQLWKEFYKKDVGFLIPSLSTGWVWMQPLSQGKTTLSYGENPETIGITSKKYQSSNQLYVGSKLTAIHKRGVLLALAFDANIAEVYPVYMGSMRLEVDW